MAKSRSNSPCRDCGQPVERGSPQCIHCGSRHPHLHPEINRFVREPFSHGLISDYSHSGHRLEGSGKRSFPAFPWALTGATLMLGGKAIFPGPLSQLGTLLLLISLLLLAWGSVNGARKKFKIQFTEDGKPPKWSSNDHQYWRPVREFFGLIKPSRNAVTAGVSRFTTLPPGWIALGVTILFGLAQSSSLLPKKIKSIAKREEGPAATGSLVEADMLAKGIQKLRESVPDELRKRISQATDLKRGGKTPAAAPSSANAPLPRGSSTPDPGATDQILSEAGIQKTAERIPDEVFRVASPDSGILDLAEYLIAEPGTLTWLSPEGSPDQGLIEVRSWLGLVGWHESRRTDFEAGSLVSARSRTSLAYTYDSRSIRLQGWFQVGGGAPISERLELDRNLSRATQLPRGMLLESFAGTLSTPWGVAGPCFEWSRPAPRPYTRWRETFCKGHGLLRAELRDGRTGARLASWTTRARLPEELRDGANYPRVSPDPHRAPCAAGKSEDCRNLGLALELAGTPLDALAPYGSACKANDRIACLALGSLEARMGSMRAAYLSLWKGCRLGQPTACRMHGYLALAVLGHDEALPGLEEACRRLDGYACAILGRLLSKRKSSEPSKTAHQRACGLGVTASCYLTPALSHASASLLPQFPHGAGALSMDPEFNQEQR